jgi:hypothetical protein
LRGPRVFYYRDIPSEIGTAALETWTDTGINGKRASMGFINAASDSNLSLGEFHLDHSQRCPASLLNARPCCFTFWRFGHTRPKQTHRLCVPRTQQPSAVLSAPLKHLIRVHHMRPRHPRHRSPCRQRLFDSPPHLLYRPPPSHWFPLKSRALRRVHESPQVDTSVSAYFGNHSHLLTLRPDGLRKTLTAGPRRQN